MACVNETFIGNGAAWNGSQAGGAAGGATGAIIGSIVPGLGTALGGAIGNLVGKFGGSLFGGVSEDTSTAGWMNFNNELNCAGIQRRFPTARELQSNANKLTGKSKGFVSTYIESEGYLRDGDWIGQIVQTTPVVFKWFKGAKESFVEQTNWFWTPPQPPPVSQQTMQRASDAAFLTAGTSHFQKANNLNTLQEALFSPFTWPLLIVGAIFALFLIFKPKRK